MSAYFDIRSGSVAIVETDTPDPDWIKLTSKQSRLAARYRVEGGKVVDAYPGKTDEDVLADIAAAQAAPPQTPVAASAKLTKLEFMNRFTLEELAAIYTAAKANVLVEVWMDKLKLASEVDLSDPATIAGVQSLAAQGLLTEARAQEVLQR